MLIRIEGSCALDLILAVLKIVFRLYFILLEPQQRDKRMSILLFLFSFSSFSFFFYNQNIPHIFDYSRVEIAVYQAFSEELLHWFGDLSFFWGTVWFRKIASHSNGKTNYQSLTACSQAGAYLFFWTKGNNVYVMDMQRMQLWLYYMNIQMRHFSVSIWKQQRENYNKKAWVWCNCDAEVIKTLNFFTM